MFLIYMQGGSFRMVTLLGLTRDFHPLDNAHAEHTTKRAVGLVANGSYYGI